MNKLTKLLIIGTCITLTSCSCWVAGAGGFELDPKSNDPGQGYRDSQLAAMLACNFSEDNREPQSGDGYRDSKNAAEDADCHGD